MAHRDRLNEILEIKKRSGRHKRRTSTWDLERLGRMRASEREDQQLLDELIPARIVTLLEVFVRMASTQCMGPADDSLVSKFAHCPPFLDRG